MKLIASLLMLVLSPLAGAENSSVLNSELMPRASQSILMDAVKSGERFVVVGERGHVLTSDDGQAWSQSETPTRSSLTTVASIGSDVWAAGHDAVILHSDDGGLTWSRQHVAEDVNDPDINRPVLDIFFVDESYGFALGAYAFFMRTEDGGATWEELDFNTLVAIEEAIEDEEADDDTADGAGDESGDDGGYQDYSDYEDEFFDYHLNGMTQLANGTLFIAAEQGNAFVSRDQGNSWSPIQMPYEGSMFGAVATTGGSLVTYGLRGNAFESSDEGATWTQLETGTLNSLFGAANTAAGGLLLVGANGEVVVRDDPNGPIRSQPHSGGGDLSAIAVAGDGFVVAGEDGVTRYTVAGGE